MRGPTRDELLKTVPPELRTSSKTVQAYLAVRAAILKGELPAEQVLVPRQMEEQYQINNTSTQILLMRLANEGLVQVLPIKERSWPNNAAFNLYRVADRSRQQTLRTNRGETGLPGGASGAPGDEQELLTLKIQYADAEIAALLGMNAGDRVVFYRERLRTPRHDVSALIDHYLPFWFAEMLPELEQQQQDISTLLRLQGKYPATWTESVDVVQASSVERVLFELSPDDPAPLLKLERLTYDAEGHPLVVQFLTLKPEHYRLHYSGSTPADRSLRQERPV